MILIVLAIFLAILSFCVLIHEAGHYLVAKKYGVPVYEFCIGFPGTPKLFTFYRHNETEFTVRLLPLGGFVRFGNEDNLEEAFLSGVSSGRKAAILAAGSVVNVLFGAVLLVATLTIGKGLGLYDATAMVMTTIYQMIVGTISAVVQFKIDDFMGPVGMTNLAGTAINKGVVTTCGFTGIISIAIGITNLIPFPGFDGWHLMLSGVEAIRRKPLSQKLQMQLGYVGLALFLVLMVVVTYNDIGRMLHGNTM